MRMILLGKVSQLIRGEDALETHFIAVFSGKINLVDLAGSENNKVSIS